MMLTEYIQSSPKTHQGHPGALQVVTRNICVIGSNNMQPMPGAALSSPRLFRSYRDRRSVTEPYRQTGGSFSILTKHVCTHYFRTLSVSCTDQTLIDTTSSSNPLLHLKLLWPDWAERRVQGMELFAV